MGAMMKKSENNNNTNNNNGKKIWTMVKILIILFIFSALIAMIFSGDDEDTITGYNTAIIQVNGVITTEDASGFFSDGGASSTALIKNIEKAKNDANVKAVIFEINSPGGSAVATDEIAQAVKTLKDNNITTVAWIRESGASGAYWIASSTDHIVANRMSIVGSIGVIGSYLEFSGLMNRYNVSYQRLVSGKYKDMGTPYKELTPAEEKLMQQKLDKIHQYFISEVSTNRNMKYEDVEKLATGEIFLGVEAKDNGLIDELGGKEETIRYVEKKLNETVVTKEFTKDKSFIESLTSAMNKNSFYIGQGIASGIVKTQEGVKITT
jgi:protease-4